MKLRQKLAVVLAATMVATSVPVVTMAASNNRLKIDTQTLKKDTFITTGSTINIEFKDHMDGEDEEVFYLKLTNCEFNKDRMKGLYSNTEADGRTVFEPTSGVKYIWQTDKEIKVDATAAANAASDDIVRLPLEGIKVTGGDASIEIIANRSACTVSGQKFVLANTSDKLFKFSVGDKKTFYTDSNSKLSELTLDETFTGSLFGDDDKQTIITLELDDTDFNFYGFESVSKKDDVFTDGEKLISNPTGDEVQDVEYKYGFNSSNVETYAAVDSKDKGKLYIGIKALGEPDSTGQIVFKNLRVDCLVNDPDTGDFLVDIKGGDLAEEKDNVVMGEVCEFSAYIKMDEDKAKEVVGGRQEEIKFEVGESVENSMVTGREMEIKFDENAHFDYKWLVDEYVSYKGYADTKAFYQAVLGDADNYTDDDAYKMLAANLPKAWLTDKIVDNKDDWTVADKDAEDNTLVKGKQLYVEFDKDDDGKAIVDTLIVFVGRDDDEHETQSNDDKDKIKFKLKACVPLDKKDNEKAELKVTGRAIDAKEVSTTAITIKNPLTLTTEPVTLKVGLQNQVGGKIVIAETDKEMFQQDGTITISVKDKAAGIKFQEDCEFESTSGIKKVKVDTKKDGTVITFTIKRDSKEAATITIPELHFTVDRTVPEGTYDIEIGGTALDKDGHKLTVEDFIVIGTKNTGDIENAGNGLAAGTAKFVIGESKYTLNDKEAQMDAAAYIQDPGFTMVPVRYVAEAFGVSKENILFGNGTVTLFAGTRTIQLTNGSNVALVNGAPVSMATAVVIKEGRTYAPIGEIATILGIQKTWDAATKTAVFTN